MAIIDSQVHAYEANTPKRPWALRYAAEMPRLPIKTLRPCLFFGIVYDRFGIQSYCNSRATVVVAHCSGPGSLNRFSASLSGVSAGVRLPCGWAAG
jgi:hypothetical protein